MLLCSLDHRVPSRFGMDPTINLWRKAGKSRLLILLLHNSTILTLTICLILLYDNAVIVLLVPTSRDRRVEVDLIWIRQIDLMVNNR